MTLPEPSTPFGKALARALPQIESLLMTELQIVIEEERRAAYAQGLAEGARRRVQRPSKGAPTNDELRQIYPKRGRS